MNNASGVPLLGEQCAECTAESAVGTWVIRQRGTQRDGFSTPATGPVTHLLWSPVAHLLWRWGSPEFIPLRAEFADYT